MIERLYSKEVDQTKYDLMYCIKGFMNIYSHLFFYSIMYRWIWRYWLGHLWKKTNVLARHTTMPFISQELLQMCKQPMNEEVTKEQILAIMEQKNSRN
ncbi:hypothetical protein GCM10020331_074400 [Ectobacillus funiculus]